MDAAHYKRLEKSLSMAEIAFTEQPVAPGNALMLHNRLLELLAAVTSERMRAEQHERLDGILLPSLRDSIVDMRRARELHFGAQTPETGVTSSATPNPFPGVARPFGHTLERGHPAPWVPPTRPGNIFSSEIPPQRSKASTPSGA